MKILYSLALFFIAGLCEIGGGYLIWLSIRGSHPFWLGIMGGIALAAYGVVATLQPAHFGRVYAAYGGVFIVMSVLWGWIIDGIKPDFYDLLGGLIALSGVMVIMYAPRG